MLDKVFRQIESKRTEGALALWSPRHSALLLLFGIAGVSIALIATRIGPGITSDSMAYMAAGETWRLGLGLGSFIGPDGFKPLNHFPPLFPLLLAGGQSLGINPIEAARLVNSLFHGALILLIGLFAGQLGQNIWASLLGAGTALLSPILLHVNAQAMSEPGFLFFGLFGLWLVSRWVEEGSRWRIVLAGMSIGLAYLTRYIGLSLILSTLLYLMLASEKPLRTRVSTSALFISLSLPMNALWILRNIQLTGNATNRRWLWHPPSRTYFTAALRNLWNWVSPIRLDTNRLEAIAGLVLVLGLVVFLLWLVRQRKDQNLSVQSQSLYRRLCHPLVFYAPLYLAMIVISRYFVDAATPLDNRIASPIYLTLIVVVSASLPVVWEQLKSKKGLLVFFLLASALFLASYAIRILHEMSTDRALARGSIAINWRQGPIEAIWDLPGDAVIFTDDLERLYFYYARGGYQVQKEIDSVTGLPRSDDQTNLEQAREMLMGAEAILLMFASEDLALTRYPGLLQDLEPGETSNLGTLYRVSDSHMP